MSDRVQCELEQRLNQISRECHIISQVFEAASPLNSGYEAAKQQAEAANHIGVMASIGLPIYVHYKGGRYVKIAEATVEATMEEVVVYQCTETAKVWTRPHAEFYGTVEVDGVAVPRFHRIEKSKLGDPSV